jgi:hypothetical protein
METSIDFVDVVLRFALPSMQMTPRSLLLAPFTDDFVALAHILEGFGKVMGLVAETLN